MKLVYWLVYWLVYLCSLMLVACAASQPAPVIERAPQAKKTESAKKPPANASATVPKSADKDWRPEVYTVKKGDTLHSIGLEYGYDYKEIAQTNNIQPPYIIHIGQQLKIKSAEAKPALAASDNKNAADANVVITPLANLAGNTAPQPTQPSQAASDIPLLKEPKALREVYSPQALAAVGQEKAASDIGPSKAAEPAKMEPANPGETAKPDVTKPEATADDDESIDWGWPVTGKIIAGFDDANSAKGIDIAGTQGQAILAAAPGKVIYSGSDLRGYGKLVIIKHNKTYLSVYAHNSQILVKEGQQISKGQKIAEMGNSETDRVKLHFEIRRQGKSVDPEKYLSSKQN